MSNPSVTAPASNQSSAVERRAYLVELQGITKAFGPTLANADIDFAVANSDVVGLVGGNGAGKSTLMRILCGITTPTLGQFQFDGAEEAFLTYDASAAQTHGIRMVHQELSLCSALTVAENFFIENSWACDPAPKLARRVSGHVESCAGRGLSRQCDCG